MNKLSLDTIRLLSSSQVVTSVSSAVKELVENALDGGATNLDVKLEKWGLDKIEVRDNGCGIQESDASLMGQSHYTSKISKHEDLEVLNTYGFRGEALGSLCQVSDVSITTKTAQDAVAVSYTLDQEGKISSRKPTHDGNGTTVVACNIFRNLPVRKQFYGSAKKCKEELKNIEDLLMAYGLINPVLRVTLRNNKNLVWQKNKSCDVKTALMDVFGIHIFNQLEYIEHVDESLPITLKCFVPKRDSDSQLTSRSSEDRCFLFVNKRYVIWKELMQVLKKNCVWRNMESSSGKFPLCFISVCLSSKDVDANLEPNKTKVLIQPKEEVLEIITHKLCQLYNLENGQSSECRKDKDEENVAEEKFGVDEYSKAKQNGTDIVHGVSETLKKTESNHFIRSESSTKKPEKQLLDIDDVSHQSDFNKVDRDSTYQENNSTGVNIDDISNCNDAGVITDHTLLQNNLSCENACPSLQNGCSETSNDCSSIQNNVKESSNKEKRSDTTPLSHSCTEQFGLDDLLTDLVDDWDVLDDSTFTIESPQPSLDKWSKGQGLDDKNGKAIEPVKLLTPSTSKTALENRANASPTLMGKRKHSSVKSTPSPKPSAASKKMKTTAKISGQPLLTSVLQTPKLRKPTTTRRTTKQVSFSLSLLKKLASDKRPPLPPCDDIKLIKRLDPWGVWLVCKKRELCILNPYRIQELLLYKRLLASHALPREKLGKAIILDEKILGGCTRYSLLENLIEGGKDSERVRYYDDERLVSNGFEICARFDPETAKTRLEILKLNTTIPYFGVRDLIEVLDLIKDEKNASSPSTEKHQNRLANCRPSKVCNFLKEEVVRVSRGLTSRMTETDVNFILNNMKKELTEDENSCVHNLPFLYPLIASSY